MAMSMYNRVQGLDGNSYTYSTTTYPNSGGSYVTAGDLAYATYAQQNAKQSLNQQKNYYYENNGWTVIADSGLHADMKAGTSSYPTKKPVDTHSTRSKNIAKLILHRKAQERHP